VVAIGTPLGYDRSVTVGIVSAVQRAISAPNQFPIDHVIQTDAPINHGNSGGPLINSRGQVIGVNAQIATDGTGSDGNIGIGFAIPSNTVRIVAGQLIKKGKVEHAFIGITAKPVGPEIARLFRLSAKRGLLVATVQSGSGAAAAGLRAGTNTAVVSGESWPVGGDLIVSADGVPLSSIDQLRDLIAAKNPGQSISLEVYRGTEKLTLNVKLGRQPSAPGTSRELALLASGRRGGSRDPDAEMLLWHQRSGVDRRVTETRAAWSPEPELFASIVELNTRTPRFGQR
jgi:S1-C subfamily serine protease